MLGCLPHNESIFLNIFLFFRKCIPLRGSYFPAGEEGKSCLFAPVVLSHTWEATVPAKRDPYIGWGRLQGSKRPILSLFWLSWCCEEQSNSFCAVRNSLQLRDSVTRWSWEDIAPPEQWHLSPFLCPLSVPAKKDWKNIPQLAPDGLCSWRGRIHECLWLHQKPNGGTKPKFLGKMLSHKTLALLHIWWEFCSAISLRAHKLYDNQAQKCT